MLSVPLVSEETVKEHLKFSKLVPAIKCALEEFSSRTTQQPMRTFVWMENSRRMVVMPSYSRRMGALSTKVILCYPDLAEKGMQIRHSYLLFPSVDTGKLECLMESEPITWMRTAAASVVATQTLVRGTPKVLALLGTGNVSAYHTMAFNEMFEFSQIKVWGRNPENVGRYCARLENIPLTACESAEEAVSDADVVITATSSVQPVLEGKWLKPGCHINAVGSIKPTWREIDDECMYDSVIYADSRESAEKESGEVVMSKAEVYAEIGEVLIGAKPKKYGKFTLFKSLGLAIEDTYAAKLVWNRIGNTSTDNMTKPTGRL